MMQSPEASEVAPSPAPCSHATKQVHNAGVTGFGLMTTGRPVSKAARHSQQTRDQSSPRSQGPVIAKVTPGDWRLTNSHLPEGSKVAPAHSVSR